MENTLVPTPKTRIYVPVIALTLYAVASGYLMSLIPLMLPEYGLESSLASWLASAFYAGLLVGALAIEPIVAKFGHRKAYTYCLVAFISTIAAMLLLPSSMGWLAARFIAGISVAGIFVIVESWLLHGDESGRAKRLGLYMGALYGGSSLGQLGIGILGIQGSVPFIAIGTLLILAVLVVVFGDSEQPPQEHTEAMSLKQIMKLNHAAIIGCIVSGLTLGAIYGLMPIELSQRHIPTSDIGTLMALIILGGMAVQPMVPWVSKFFGRTLLMAMFCLIGVGALALAASDARLSVLAVSLFVIGMATFALYPIAINLGCDKLDANHIVSATQVMLFSYSVGSVIGPMVADLFMDGEHGLMEYLFLTLMATCVYMLFASIKNKGHIVAGE